MMHKLVDVLMGDLAPRLPVVEALVDLVEKS